MEKLLPPPVDLARQTLLSSWMARSCVPTKGGHFYLQVAQDTRATTIGSAFQVDQRVAGPNWEVGNVTWIHLCVGGEMHVGYNCTKLVFQINRVSKTVRREP